jgi:transglutaminase-like putative cysteine protease
MFDEPSMPPYDNVLQRLLVSTLPDWPAVSKWYWNLSQPHLDATSPELENKVAELTAGTTNDLEKIMALFYHVSGNIRYMGLTPEKDRPGFEPHDVRLTFEKNYGVCRDKAALLVAMLREAGLKAYPVLINVGGKLDPEVPRLRRKITGQLSPDGPDRRKHARPPAGPRLQPQLSGLPSGRRTAPDQSHPAAGKTSHAGANHG